MNLTIEQHNQIEADNKELKTFSKEDIIEIYAQEVMGEENINREASKLFNKLYRRFKDGMTREIINKRKKQMSNKTDHIVDVNKKVEDLDTENATLKKHPPQVPLSDPDQPIKQLMIDAMCAFGC